MDWLKQLNPAQLEAVTATDRAVLVIAGAGTGKTRTLASRVAWLIGQGTPADRILLLTFTRRAAAEMLARAAAIAGAEAARVWGGTFHAIANRLLRHHGRAVGLSPDFTVMDQSDAADLMNLIRGELGHGKAKSQKRFPRKNTLFDIYSRTVNSRTRLSQVLARFFPWCADSIEGIREIFETYARRKAGQSVLDYDDLLLYWKALSAAPEVGELLAARFDHVLVDEYQDTNLIQAEILAAMRRGGRNVMAVGDDAQSIYSFRSATVRNILDFPAQFEGTRVVKLEQNYRSVQPILDAANAVMDQAGERFTKNLFSNRPSEQRPVLVASRDEAEQCTEVCDRVLEKHEEGVPLKQQAVLFRAGHHSDQLEVELARRNIPFVKYGGLKFVEAAHVKDMIALLRVLENPHDQISWYRVLLLLEGIGPATAGRIMAALGVRTGAGAGQGRTPERGGDSPTTEEATGAASALGLGELLDGRSPLAAMLESPPTVPPAARKEFAALRELIADCRGGGLGPAAQVERVRRFYEPVFARIYDNPAVRLRDLDQLETIAAGYRSRSQFITDLTLDPPASTQDLAGAPLLDEDYLILSTIHSAKGCEWDVVHILHAADGMIPSDMATGSPEEIDEERRLLYVAMTRPRNALYIHFPLRYYHSGSRLGDVHSYAQLSRFLAPLGKGLLERQRSKAVREEREEDGSEGAGSAAGSGRSVQEMLSDLWSG